LQSLVRTKCWSIAPLWKFVTYELEQGPTRPTSASKTPSRRSSSGGKKGKTISYENNVMSYKSATTGMRKPMVWSKPAPHQTLQLKKQAPPQQPRQPLQSQTNHLQGCQYFENKSSNNGEVINNEWKPCGVLKKPGSYRGHVSLKKVAFLENTELNRSTL
jgi:hypothetical protein